MIRNIATGEIREITIDAVPEHKRQLWEAYTAPERAPLPLAEVKARALRHLLSDIEEARQSIASHYITQNDIYQLKGALAVNAKRPLQSLDGLSAEAASEASRGNQVISQARDMLTIEASAVGSTWEALADQIIAKRDVWTGIAMQLEAVRRSVAASIDGASTSDQVTAIMASATALINQIKGG